MRGLFLALPAILLSPKRAMRQSVLRTDTQPLGTGRHLLAQMDVYSFPLYVHPRKRMTAIQSLSGAFALARTDAPT